ncbi:MAG TPA: VWA domain-containing protein [Planctomycetota bacterium]|nr:VWA domain-containing protein [Planctomycetota bacterium]
MITEEMLTAYALGETSHLSAAEKEALERHVQENPDASKFIAEMRSTAGELTRELKSESGVGLEAAQKTAIRAAAGSAAQPAKKVGGWTWQTVAMAASVLMVVGVVGLLLPKLSGHMAANETASAAACKAYAGAEESPYRRTDYDNDGVVEYAQTLKGSDSLLQKTREQGDLALVDKTFGLAEGKAGSATVVLGGNKFPAGGGPGEATPKGGFHFDPTSGTSSGSTTSSSSSGGSTTSGTTSTSTSGGGMTLGYSLSAVPGAYDEKKRDTFVISNNGTVFQQDRGGNKHPAKAPDQGKMTHAVAPAAVRDGDAKALLAVQDPGKGAGHERQKLKKSANEKTAAVEEKARKYQQKAQLDQARSVSGLVQTWAAGEEEANTEQYDPITDNAFERVMQKPLSTFSIDVDTASYSLMRRNVTQGMLPAPDSVRIEEMINYFPYSYTAPASDSADPFAANVEVAKCPWNPEHRLARVAIKGKEIAADKRPASNLVFLIDVSGSMDGPNRLPLVQKSLKMLVDKLGENDLVALAVYAGRSGLVLDSTSCSDKQKIKDAIDNLRAGGGTNGAQGIQLAYDTATKHFIKGATNRVILCTDGDWNIGVTSDGDLVRLITEKAKTGVFLSVLGFGMGNYKDGKMEKMADKGNGNYAYIDDEKEAKKALVEQLSGTLVTIAKDVKIQVEFNPAKVNSYRLIGYENRMLAAEDFNNDKKDAGEIGAGHTVTALYEIVPAGKTAPVPTVDQLEYQVSSSLTDKAYTDQIMTLKIRYKQPDGDTSKLLKFPINDSDTSYAKASEDYKFAAAVAQFGMLLRGSPYSGNATFASVKELAAEAIGKDAGGYRAEFLTLIDQTTKLLNGRSIPKQELPVQEAPQPAVEEQQPAPALAPAAPNGDL